MYASSPRMVLNSSASWDRIEEKIFENCLVEIPDCVENRWHMIARRITGKSPEDVRAHYEALLSDVMHIFSGIVRPPSYPDKTATVSLGWDDPSRLRDPGQISFASGNRNLEVERKKGTPWTEKEHRLFLIGLERYGRGDWRSISRKVIVSKTPTQVASHAQKYFLRQSDGKKQKKRSSIHDITTAVDSLTVSAQPNLLVPDQANLQSSHSPTWRSVTVLAMNIRRCEHCRTKLKEKLLKMPGVNSCDMDIENNLVVVMGTLDPMILAKDVAKLGKRVELLSYDKYPKNFQEKVERNKAKGSDQERGKKHKKRPCNSSFYKDERASMDYFCKIHPNFEPTQMDLCGEFGHYTHSGYNPGSNAPYPFGYM